MVWIEGSLNGVTGGIEIEREVESIGLEGVVVLYENFGETSNDEPFEAFFASSWCECMDASVDGFAPSKVVEGVCVVSNVSVSFFGETRCLGAEGVTGTLFGLDEAFRCVEDGEDV